MKKRANLLILILSCLCLSSSGCPATTHGVNASAAMPPPQNMGKACDPMGIRDVPTKAEGFAKLEPGASCAAVYRCDAPDGCTLEVTSRAQSQNAVLAFVVDARSNDATGTPSAVGGPSPAPGANTLSLRLSKSGFYGTGDGQGAEKLIYLGGGHWARSYDVRGVGNDPPLSITAVVKVQRGAEIGQFGFRPY